jgi:hypothetical protein
MRPITRLVLASVLLGASACTNAVSNGTASQQTVISRADIERAHVSTVLDAIRRYRSDALVARAPSSIYLDKQTYPVVFLDNELYGQIDELRNISADAVEEIRFFSGTDAVRRFGAQYGGGVIQVVSRNGG